MTKRIVAVFTFCFVTLTQAQTISPKLRFDLILGDDESKPKEYLFASPKFISTDSRNNIFVADRKNMRIRVFNEQGEFVKTIGAKGRGPGEFLDITSMVVDNQDDLIVVDHFNMRITRFSNMGLQVETYPIPISGRAQPWHIRTLGPQAGCTGL